MIGEAYNPNNCVFLGNQSFNANQFDPNVPDAENTRVCVFLWDFIATKLYWVDGKTNLILQELIGGGLQNNVYDIVSEGPYDIVSSTPPGNYAVIGNNYLVLQPGTYVVDAEYTFATVDEAPSSTCSIQIRTNTNPLIISANPSDNIIAERDTCPGATTDDIFLKNVILTQTAKTQVITIPSSGPNPGPWVVKTAFSVLNESGAIQLQNILLRAFLVK